jgi:gliding motility-associated-like protein
MNRAKYILVSLVCVLLTSCSEYKWVDVSEHFWHYNTFSPNKNGPNETFYLIPIYGVDIQEFHLTIYDQYLHSVFSTNDINQAWDGTSGGIEVPQGTYEYQILYKASEDSVNYENYSAKSSITLIRES